VIGVLVLVDNQQTIDNTLLSGQIQTEIYSDRHTINTQKKLSKAMLFLNRTTKMYNSSNQPIANLCTVDYTVCETNNSLLVSTISKVYLLHGALQQQLFSDEGYQPLSIYYNSSSTEIVLINIYQQNITDSILTFANNSQFKTVIGQAITPDMSSSQQGSYYYFSYSNYFIACKWFESIVDVYSCMASLNS
jgi:hypothetical protein